MATVEYDGKSYQVNREGFLLKCSDWDENWVAHHEQEYATELAIIRGKLHVEYKHGNSQGIYPNTLVNKVRSYLLKGEGLFWFYDWHLTVSGIDRKNQINLMKILAKIAGATSFSSDVACPY